MPDPFTPQQYTSDLLDRAIAQMPSTISKPDEIDAWVTSNIRGRSYDQLEIGLQSKFFGIDQDNYFDYAATEIENRRQQGIEVSPGEQLAITDMMRQQASVQPVHFDPTSLGAMPIDRMKEYEQRRKESRSRIPFTNIRFTGAFDNFLANTSETMLSSMGGINLTAARATDAIGITDNRVGKVQEDMDNMRLVLSTRGGASGIAGQLVGNTLFSFMLAGTGVAAGITKQAATSGWKAALGRMITESGPIGLAFGIAETGTRFGEINRRRQTGQNISLADELVYAFAGGAAEAAGEMFGWHAARGVAGSILRNIPGLKSAVTQQGLRGFVSGIKQIGKSTMGAVMAGMPQGAAEEAFTQIAQNLVDKFTGVISDAERGEWGILSGVGRATLMGALQPLVSGVPMGIVSRITRPPMTTQGEATIIENVSASDALETVNQARTQIAIDINMSVAEKQEIGKLLDEAEVQIQAGPIPELYGKNVPEVTEEIIVPPRDISTQQQILEGIAKPQITEAAPLKYEETESLQTQIEAIEQKRIETRDRADLTEDQKETVYEQLDVEVASIQKDIDIQKDRPIHTPTEQLVVPPISQVRQEAAQKQLEAIVPQEVTPDRLAPLEPIAGPPAKPPIDERLIPTEAMDPKAVTQGIPSKMGEDFVPDWGQEDVGEITEAPGVVHPHPESPQELATNIESRGIVPGKEARQQEDNKEMKSWGEEIVKGYAGYSSGMWRVERLLSKADGYEIAGENYRLVFEPITKAAEAARMNSRAKVEELRQHLNEEGVNIDSLFGKDSEQEVRKGLILSGNQRIAAFLLSKNVNGLRHLREGNKILDSDIRTIDAQMSKQEKDLAYWLQDRYSEQATGMANAYKAVTGDDLVIEENYSPISIKDIRKKKDSMSPESILADETVKKGKKTPKDTHTIARSKNANQEVELDALGAYMVNIHNVERYVAIAPTAVETARVIGNADYQSAIDSVSHGQGSRILNKWLKDTVRGHGDTSHRWLNRQIDMLRKNGAVAAVGANALVMSKQALSAFVAASYGHGMSKRMMINMMRASVPGQRQRMIDFVNNKTNLLMDRNMERDIRSMEQEKSIKQKLKGQKSLSDIAMAGVKFVDRGTVAATWVSFYETLRKQYPDFSEVKIIEMANIYTKRTQPAANVEDLPDYFRGGTLERLFTTFGNPVNQIYNWVAHDTIGMMKAGKISKKKAAYQFAIASIVPSMVMGMINRGDLPDDPEEVLVDVITYPIAGMFAFGNIINSLMRGYDAGTIASNAIAEAGKTVSEIVSDDPNWGEAAAHALKALGSIKGVPVNAPLRTITGAYDLAAEETEDWRRLIWSEYTLDTEEKKEVY